QLDGIPARVAHREGSLDDAALPIDPADAAVVGVEQVDVARGVEGDAAVVGAGDREARLRGRSAVARETGRAVAGERRDRPVREVNAPDAHVVVNEKEIVPVGGDPRRIAELGRAGRTAVTGKALPALGPGDGPDDAVRTDLPNEISGVGEVDVAGAVEGDVVRKGDRSVERRTAVAARGVEV